MIREVHADGWRVRLDLAQQVLRLEASEDEQPRAPLLPALPCAEGGPVSAATLLLKAKQFDDGLHAAVEVAAQQGMGGFRGKLPLLRALAESLTSGPSPADLSAAALLLAACELGGSSPPIRPGHQAAVRAVIDDFLREEHRAKPLGFYTWSAQLQAVFRQDRLLQQPLDAPTVAALSRALDTTPDGWASYDACLRLATQLTNPIALASMRDPGENTAFFPPSRSHEVSLFERLYGDRLIPEGFDLMTELIRRVRAGEVRLEPGEDSGWYDWQTWSLEPLLVPDRMPERTHLELGSRYRRHLEDLFRGALALARETHVKQAGGGYGGAGLSRPRFIRVQPTLTVEPLPSLYLRRAACYRFVRSTLEEVFGAEALRGLHRLRPGGQCGFNLAEELDGMQKLFEGASATAIREVGQEPAPDTQEHSGAFPKWRMDLATDADTSCDARMMVPVFYDAQRSKMKVWAFLGWKLTPVEVSYRAAPAIVAVEPQQPAANVDPPQVLFTGDRCTFAVPVVVEVYVSRLLDRDEFRRHCDRYRTRAAILNHLH